MRDLAEHSATFVVSDGGPGIDAAMKARIFGKFERLVSASTHQSGFGLGLWIVGRMVIAHHGSIEVSTPPAGGTAFMVRLPLDARKSNVEGLTT